MSLFTELKRRNVFKVAVAYAVASWLMLQIVDLVLDNINAPDWVMQVFMLGLAVGFPIAIIIAWAFEVTPEGVKLEKNVDRSQSIARHTGQQLNRGIIMILSVAVVFLLTERFRDESFAKPEAEDIAASADAEQTDMETDIAEDTEKSIAVLPFVNMSSDPEQDYFADGISEEILNALAKVSDLKVAGRTSSFAFKGKNEDLLEIGKVLRVNHILEGSVRKSGNQLRITAQLIKVDDGFHMWSETYDRELTDIFAIQDEISTAILSQMKAQLLGEKQSLVAPADTRAYELYLLAKQRIYSRNQASMELAEKLLTEAIEIDPDYAPAYAQLGITYIFLADDAYGSMPTTVSIQKSKHNLDKALQLAPEDPEALSGMGLYVYTYELDHEKAIGLLERAVTINPNMSNANTWLANQLDTTGHIQASLQLREKTFARDPLHRPTFGNLQQTYSILGQPEKALDMLDGLQTYLPDDGLLLSDYGQVFLMTGQLAIAQNHFQKAYEKQPLNDVNRVWYGFNLLNSEKYELAAEIAPARLATLALSRLGRTEEALILGKSAIDKGQPPNWYFQALVENRRFAELINVLESRWPSLDDFSRDWPGKRGYGYHAMGYIAQAYRETGNEAKFSDAMSRLKAALDSQLAEGANNWALSVSRAHHALLADNHDAAIGFLEVAFEQGAHFDTTSETGSYIFKPLDGDPRYEVAKAAMKKRLDAELLKMNLEPSTGQDS